MPTVNDYLARLPSFNAGQPAFTSTLAALLQPLASLQGFLSGVPAQFDLDTAVGVQLDQVGLWIGRDRFIQTPITGVYFSWDTDGLGWEQGYWQGAFDPDEGISSLDDGTYRALLYAKAAANVWDSSPEAINTILNKLLADENVTATVVDNQDMSIQVTINGTLTSLVFQAILTGGYLPIKPEGVSINYLIPNTGPTLSSGTQVVGQGSVTAHAVLRKNAQVTIAGAASVAADATGGTGTGSFNASVTISGQGSVSGMAGVLSGGVLADPWSSDFSTDFGPIPSGAGGTLSIVVAGSVVASAQGRKLGASRVSGAGSVTASATVLTGSQQAFIVTTQPDLVLSNSNKTVTSGAGVTSGSWEASVGSIAHTSGKYYFEFHFDANATLPIITPGSGTFTDGSGNVYSIDSGTNIIENGSPIPGGNGTVKMEYVGGVVYAQDQSSGNWFTWDQTSFQPTGAPPASAVAVGFADNTFSPTASNASLGGAGSVGIYTDNSQTYIQTSSFTLTGLTAFATGNVLAIALDLGNNVFWVNLNNAGWMGTSNNSTVSTGSPTSNTNGIATGLTVSGGVKPAVAMDEPSVAVTAHFASSSWTYSAPTGYGAP